RSSNGWSARRLRAVPEPGHLAAAAGTTPLPAGPSAPGEHGLLEPIDPGGPPGQNFPELVEHGRRGRMDETLAHAQADHRPVAFGNPREVHRVARLDRGERDPVHRGDLV